MKERIATICNMLGSARVFADIGCDHGYCTLYMLKHNRCEKAYISDISAASLLKAEKLLARFVSAGKCVPVVADGLEGIPEPCDLVLIAGLGGEEIVKILEQHPLPARFVLQPMKNADKVRAFLIGRGAHIERDFTFSEGSTKRKYYELICGTAEGGDEYNDFELRYGRDNLSSSSPLAFLFMMREERTKLKARLARQDMNMQSRSELMEKLSETEAIIDALEDRI